jgi:hypothetical protein
MAFACADEPSALSVPPLGQFVAGALVAAEVVPVPEVGVDELAAGVPPLELHAARATVVAAMIAATEIRRVRPTGFSIRVWTAVPPDAREAL